ncbi:hypothetical protein GN156_20760, partial [bacterium LRH843]|nr:hypothetical protein [bacterium LRH843]
MAVAGRMPSNRPMRGRCPPPSDPLKCPPLYTGYMANKEYCNRYIKCVNGVGYNRTCEPPKMFDDIVLICNDPERVNCG